MDLFDNCWNNPEHYQYDTSIQQVYSTTSSREDQIMAGLVQPQPIIKIEGVAQTPVSDYDSHYGGLSTCPSPYMMSPSNHSKRRYSLGGYEQVPARWTPYTPFMSPIVTTTRSHSVKRNKRPSTYSRWTLEEDELLRQAVQVHGPHKWSLIASHVPNRTPMQCSTRWLGALNPNIHKGRWTENEDSILRYSVLEYANVTDGEGRIQPIPWNKIADRIPNRTGIQCQARWTEALDPYVRKGKWGLEEDALLRMGVQDFGRCWIRIAETIPGRTQRQCRTRWMQIKYKEDRQQRASPSSSETTTNSQQQQGNKQKPSSANTITATAAGSSVDDTLSQSYLSSDDEMEMEDEEEKQQQQRQQQQRQQQHQQRAQDNHSFFVVDDFGAQISHGINSASSSTTTRNSGGSDVLNMNPMNMLNQHQLQQHQQQHQLQQLQQQQQQQQRQNSMTAMTPPAPIIEFLKEEDFFLSADWSLSDYHQQSYNTFL